MSTRWFGTKTFHRRSLEQALLALCLVGFIVGCTTPNRELNQLSSGEREAGWVCLFDGKSLAGWAPRDQARWTVKDRAIVYRSGSGTGFLCTTGSYYNFELKVDFWVDEVANSGVFLRCPQVGPIGATNAYEVNIYDAHPKWPTGSINEVAVRTGDTRSIGRWNQYHITARGDHLVVRLNGRIIVDVHDGREKSGPIGLQQFRGTGMVRFRNLKLKPLGP
jgi:hypothetical protein